MIKARLDNVNNESWLRCGKCGHKLGKIVRTSAKEVTPELLQMLMLMECVCGIEIKCHSCKEINKI